MLNFLLKNVSSFCSAKATHIFSAKNIRILCIESAKTINEMTLNELVKLTTLWTTRPWAFLGFVVFFAERRLVSILALCSPIVRVPTLLSVVFLCLYFPVLIRAVRSPSVATLFALCVSAAADQGLHCLQIVQPFFFKNIHIISPDIPKIENGLFQYIIWRVYSVFNGLT